MFTAPVVVGIVLAPAIVALARLSGLDRDRALYPVALIVIAAYYVLFATMGGAQALPSELIAATVFIVVAIVGFRTSLWWVAAGITGHGIFDWVVHPQLIPNPGMPVFWPAFCGSIDVALGVLVALLLLRRAIPAHGSAPAPAG
jgi:hypothetical protein